MNNHCHRQSGITLVATIFILVVVASALALMQKMTATGVATLANSVQVANAELAAHAGLEWGIYGLDNGDDCATDVDGETFSLNGFSVTLVCTEVNVDPDLNELRAKAEAGNFGSADYVYREVEAVVEPDA